MDDDFFVYQLDVAPMSPEDIISAEPGVQAYLLKDRQIGRASRRQQAVEIFEKASPTNKTLGFEISSECDWAADFVETFCADKSQNAVFSLGDDPAPCRFKPGEKVLCMLRARTDKVFPAIVLGPLTEKELVRIYETDEIAHLAGSVENFMESWTDWDWDSVMVHPLVHFLDSWGEEVGETEIVHRTSVFPFK